MIVTGSWDLPVLEGVMTSGSGRCYCSVPLCRNVNKVMNNIEEHDKMSLGPS